MSNTYRPSFVRIYYTVFPKNVRQVGNAPPDPSQFFKLGKLTTKHAPFLPDVDAAHDFLETNLDRDFCSRCDFALAWTIAPANEALSFAPQAVTSSAANPEDGWEDPSFNEAAQELNGDPNDDRLHEPNPDNSWNGHNMRYTDLDLTRRRKGISC